MELHLSEEQAKALSLLLKDKVELLEDGDIPSTPLGLIAIQLERGKAIELQNIWVSLYHIQRCYGGPEEGGWYYDHYELISARAFSNPETAAYSYCDSLRTIFEETNPRENTPLLTEEAVKDLRIKPDEVEQMMLGRRDYVEAPFNGPGGDTYLLCLEPTRGEQATWRKPIYC